MLAQLFLLARKRDRTMVPQIERIPVGVLIGFLDSGKTTLLNRLLAQAGGGGSRWWSMNSLN